MSEDRQLFSEWISKHARGVLNDEATIALADVVQTVADIGKAGKLVIEITVKPAGSSKRSVSIGGKVVEKMPTPDPELSVFFIGEGGSLHRDDPFQQQIPGTAVPVDDEPVRRVDEPADEPVKVENEGEDG
jgi:hypothetical protein